jgi:hypothetical protein
MQPTVLTVDAQGRIGAVFTGHVVAQGLDLPETNVAGGEPKSKITWHDLASVIHQYITGYRGGSLHSLDAVVEAAAGVLSRLRLTAEGESQTAELAAVRGESEAGLSVEVVEAVPPTIRLHAGKIFRKLLDSEGASAFLQLPATVEPSKHLFWFGVAELTFAASTISSNIVLEHFLGETPKGVLACSLGAPEPGKIPVCNPFALGKTTFALNGEIRNPHTGKIPIFWVAVL